jgi:dihydroorotase-like cyclic amidohydrolase
MPGQLALPTAYRLVSENARAVMGLERNAIAPGATADALAVRGTSLGQVLAHPPPRTAWSSAPASSPSARQSSA